MTPSTWLIIGASRGIGLEFVRQLLDQGHQVIAAVRNRQTANQIWQLSAQQSRPGACVIEECDITSEDSIDVSFPGRREAAYPSQTWPHHNPNTSTGIRE
jgi:NAD(P)-dependent dehydrogenase (short-subunit alcohol dehydrogenase family)